MSSNIQQRVITAGIALPLMVAAILWLPEHWFALLLGIFALAGAWEWAGLAGWSGRGQRLLYLAATTALLLGCALLVWRYAASDWVLGLAAGWWLVALVMVAAYQRSATLSVRPGPLVLLAGWLVLLPAWVSLVRLHGYGEQGPYWLLYLFVLVWGADIAAYFSGRRWGRRRLASRVSPGKTWEGVAGAVAAGALWTLLAALLSGHQGLGGLLALVLGVVTVAASILGDLVESLFKREAGLKDSGNWFPGHGGVLDRIDSVTAAGPVFTGGLLVLERLS